MDDWSDSVKKGEGYPDWEVVEDRMEKALDETGRSVSKLKPHQFLAIEKCLAPVNMRMLRGLTKADVMVIILTREALMYRLQQEYQEKLTLKDRKVFKNQQAEILKLTQLLIDNDPLWQENIDLKKDLIKLESKYKLKVLKHHQTCGELNELRRRSK